MAEAAPKTHPPMIAREHIDGLILAGGQSRRMRTQGSNIDKGLLELGGKPLVHHVARFLRPWVNHLYISANRHLDIYGQYGQCVSDDPVFGADAGPLAGVASVSVVTARPWLLVSPVDVHTFPADFPARLIQEVSRGALSAYACADGRPHPLCMLVHRDLGADLRDYLQGGGRKVLDWHERRGAVPVDFGANGALFGNINTAADWQVVVANAQTSQ